MLPQSIPVEATYQHSGRSDQVSFRNYGFPPLSAFSEIPSSPEFVSTLKRLNFASSDDESEAEDQIKNVAVLLAQNLIH